MKHLLLLLALAGSFAASGQKTAVEGWKTFKHKYGFQIDLPKGFKVGAETMSGLQYYKNDHLSFDAVVVETNGEGSLQSIKQEYQQCLNFRKGVISKKQTSNQYIVMGKDSESYYIVKSFVKNSQTYTLSLKFTDKDKDYILPYSDRIVSSFE